MGLASVLDVKAAVIVATGSGVGRWCEGEVPVKPWPVVKFWSNLQAN